MSDREWCCDVQGTGMFPYTAALGGDIRDSEPVSHVRVTASSWRRIACRTYSCR